jgi:hypothetical protein
MSGKGGSAGDHKPVPSDDDPAGVVHGNGRRIETVLPNSCGGQTFHPLSSQKQHFDAML